MGIVIEVDPANGVSFEPEMLFQDIEKSGNYAFGIVLRADIFGAFDVLDVSPKESLRGFGQVILDPFRHVDGVHFCVPIGLGFLVTFYYGLL